MTHRRSILWCLFLCGILLAACSGPEAKKMKFFEKGKAFYEKADYVRAGLEFKNAIQIDPKFAEAHYMLGMANLGRGNFRGAYGAFSKAAELDPGHVQAQIQLGKLLLGGGQREKAMEKAELVLRADPRNEDALLLKGAAWLAGKETAKARVHLEALLAQGMQRPDAYLLLASAHQQEKEARKAEEVLKQGLERNGKDLSLHRALANLYASQGRADEAAVEVRKVIALDPANHGNRITLAGLYWGAKQPEKARAVLNELLAAKPDDEAVRLDVARFYAERGAVADAERELTIAIARNAKSLRPRLALGVLYLNSDRVDNAVVLLRECLTLEKDPGSPEIVQARNLLALAYLAKGELDPALKSVDAAIKASNGNVEAHMIKGRIRLLQKDGAGAVAEFRTVVQERPAGRPGVPVPGRGAPVEEGAGPHAGNAAERPEGRPEIPRRAPRARPLLRDAERSPEGGRGAAHDSRGEPGGRRGGGRAGRPVRIPEGVPEGRRGVPQGPRGGAGRYGNVPAARPDAPPRGGLPKGAGGLRRGAGKAAGFLARRERPGRPSVRSRGVRRGSGQGALAGPECVEEPPRGSGRPGHPRVDLVQEGGRGQGAGDAPAGPGEGPGKRGDQLPPRDGDGQGGAPRGGEGAPEKIGRGRGRLSGQGRGGPDAGGDMKSTRSTPVWAADNIVGPGDQLGIEVWFGDDPGSGANRHKPTKKDAAYYPIAIPRSEAVPPRFVNPRILPPGASISRKTLPFYPISTFSRNTFHG